MAFIAEGGVSPWLSSTAAIAPAAGLRCATLIFDDTGHGHDKASSRWSWEDSVAGPAADRCTWAKPPNVLKTLLKDLFEQRPEDVLSWLHWNVWRLRHEESSGCEPTPTERPDRPVQIFRPPRLQKEGESSPRHASSDSRLEAGAGRPTSIVALHRQGMDAVMQYKKSLKRAKSHGARRTSGFGLGASAFSARMSAAPDYSTAENGPMAVFPSLKKQRSPPTVTVIEPVPSVDDDDDDNIVVYAARSHADFQRTRTSQDEEENVQLRPVPSLSVAAVETAVSSQNMPTVPHHVRSIKAAKKNFHLEMYQVSMMVERNSPYVMSPLSFRYMIWQGIFVFMLLADLWVTPFAAFFLGQCDDPSWVETAQLACLAFFVLDICLQFNCGFMKDGQVVMRRSRIVCNYIRTWFWVDFFAVLPDLAFQVYAAILTAAHESVDGGGGPGGEDAVDATSLVRMSRAVKVLQSLRGLRLLRSVRLIRTQRHADWLMMHFDTGAWPKIISQLLKIQLAVLVLSHGNTIVWAALMPAGWDESLTTVNAAAFRYAELYWRSYVALTAGGYSREDVSTVGQTLFAIFVSFEHMFLLGINLVWLVVHSMANFSDVLHTTQRLQNMITYLKRYKVNLPCQLQVYQCVKETWDFRRMRRDFDALCDEFLPEELRRSLLTELWGLRLMSLGLVLKLAHWHDEFLPRVACLVRGEMIAEQVVLFSAEDLSRCCYLVLQGAFLVEKTENAPTLTSEDYLPGQWIGETALINETLSRGQTVVCHKRAECMVIEADRFNGILHDLGLEEKYSKLLHNKLWLGLCGRCGVLGDHFAVDCPWIKEPSEFFQKKWKSHKSSDGAVHFTRGSDKGDHLIEVETVLPRHNLEGYLPWCKKHDLHSLEDFFLKLEELQQDFVLCEEELAEEDLEVLRDPAVRKFRRKKKNAIGFLQTEKAKGMHLVFISHYKLEAGTEATLMHNEITRMIQEDPHAVGRDMKTPAFLDSEDLSDLNQLRAEVEKSHNLLLLLTPGVLQRPWVLVELVTAYRSGVRVLPVEVQRPGLQFQFPSEEFYNRLLAGQELDDSARKLLEGYDIEMEELADALRNAFMRIALPFSPHKSATIRVAEIVDLMKQCPLRDGINSATQIPFLSQVSSILSLAEADSNGLATSSLLGGRASKKKHASNGAKPEECDKRRGLATIYSSASERESAGPTSATRASQKPVTSAKEPELKAGLLGVEGCIVEEPPTAKCKSEPESGSSTTDCTASNDQSKPSALVAPPACIENLSLNIAEEGDRQLVDCSEGAFAKPNCLALKRGMSQTLNGHLSVKRLDSSSQRREVAFVANAPGAS
eukprot:TRINITY_DN25237_c0_g1_i1.p1 TRINITY_DN25237_c0_g1~~TRINITY_DN25237_c0_g1_i1.p1  ORF type:complete len:1327 (+),score=278.77 TRINITY_DN25237_c0_g1_i1:68-4048(+)